MRAIIIGHCLEYGIVEAPQSIRSKLFPSGYRSRGIPNNVIKRMRSRSITVYVMRLGAGLEWIVQETSVKSSHRLKLEVSRFIGGNKRTKDPGKNAVAMLLPNETWVPLRRLALSELASTRIRSVLSTMPFAVEVLVLFLVKDFQRFIIIIQSLVDNFRSIVGADK
ncbi:hypothetical protein Tco_0153523 [Tanacetum coccineum]